MEPGTSFTRLDFDAGERFVRLRRELGVTTFGMNLILLEPGQRSRIHRHEHQEEVYLVLEGTLTLFIEGEERTLERWDLGRVGPDVRRQLLNKGPGRLALLALGSANAHDGRDGRAYLSWDETGKGQSPQDVPLPEDLPV
jgi:uncharacterized cupin superfamily protein